MGTEGQERPAQARIKELYRQDAFPGAVSKTDEGTDDLVRREGRREGSSKNPPAMSRLGTFSGYELLERYVPEGRFSRRASVYVYVCPEQSRTIVFTQVSCVRLSLVEDRSEKSIERMLTFDAVSRTKQRIRDQAFTPGEVYTSELSAEHVDSDA